MIAAGAYLAARELGLRIPGDLSVVGFDGLDIARVLDPPLTTVVADGEELGRVAFELLSAQLGGGRPRSRVMQVALEVRGSTAPPRGERRADAVRRVDRAIRGRRVTPRRLASSAAPPPLRPGTLSYVVCSYV